MNRMKFNNGFKLAKSYKLPTMFISLHLPEIFIINSSSTKSSQAVFQFLDLYSDHLLFQIACCFKSHTLHYQSFWNFQQKCNLTH
uniref:Uncharacterized protein n=1 Tax=Rhizophora mucronata TaxID=61149 RepID=A0A2P2P1E2_RHIMU